MTSFKHTAAQLPTLPPNIHATQRQALLWVISSTTGILTTRLLLVSSEPAIADALLLIHVVLALTLYIFNYGLKIFLRLPAVSAQKWKLPIGLHPRPIRCIWIDWLCRVLYVVLTTVSLVCGIHAIAELQNLPVTIALMQMSTIPRDLFMACFGLMWWRSMCRSNWGELRFLSGWLAYQVGSVIGICWLCWINSRAHLTGVLSAVASSISSWMATVLHQWIAEDVRNQGLDKLGIHAFDAVVLAINAVVLASTSHLRSNAIIGLTKACKAPGTLFVFNMISGALAIYTAGGVVRRLRTTRDTSWLSWTNMCFAIVWCVVLIACEFVATGRLRLAPLDVVICIAFMAGRQPIEESYQALQFQATWVGERRARSIV